MKNIKYYVLLSILEYLFFHATLQTSDIATPFSTTTSTQDRALSSDALNSNPTIKRVTEALLTEIMRELMNTRLNTQTNDQAETFNLLPTASNIIKAHERYSFLRMTQILDKLEHRPFASYVQDRITLAMQSNQVATQNAFKTLVLQNARKSNDENLQLLPTLPANLQNDIINFVYQQLDPINTQLPSVVEYRDFLQKHFPQQFIGLPAELTQEKTELTQEKIFTYLNKTFKKLILSDERFASYYPEIFAELVLQSLKQEFNNKAAILYKNEQSFAEHQQLAAKQERKEQIELQTKQLKSKLKAKQAAGILLTEAEQVILKIGKDTDNFMAEQQAKLQKTTLLPQEPKTAAQTNSTAFEAYPEPRFFFIIPKGQEMDEEQTKTTRSYILSKLIAIEAIAHDKQTDEHRAELNQLKAKLKTLDAKAKLPTQPKVPTLPATPIELVLQTKQTPRISALSTNQKVPTKPKQPKASANQKVPTKPKQPKASAFSSPKIRT